MHINPNGFLILICMAITHIGLIIDLLCGKNILIWFYQKADRFLKKKIFWIPFVLLGTGFLACNFHFKVKKKFRSLFCDRNFCTSNLLLLSLMFELDKGTAQFDCLFVFRNQIVVTYRK